MCVSRFSQASTWEAQIGLHTQRNIANTVVKRNLKQIIPHPHYNAYTFDNDIALMELDSPVTYSDYIRPICLPAPTHDFPAGDTVWITGWGATREGGQSVATNVEKLSSKYLSTVSCLWFFPLWFIYKIICIGCSSSFFIYLFIALQMCIYFAFLQWRPAVIACLMTQPAQPADMIKANVIVMVSLCVFVIQVLLLQCSKRLRSESSTAQCVALWWQGRSHLGCCVLECWLEGLMPVR